MVEHKPAETELGKQKRPLLYGVFWQATNALLDKSDSGEMFGWIATVDNKRSKDSPSIEMQVTDPLNPFRSISITQDNPGQAIRAYGHNIIHKAEEGSAGKEFHGDMNGYIDTPKRQLSPARVLAAVAIARFGK